MTGLFSWSCPRNREGPNREGPSNDDVILNRSLGGIPILRATAASVEGESGRSDAARFSVVTQLADSMILEGMSTLRCPAFSTKSLRVGKATFTKPRWCQRLIMSSMGP